MIPDCVGDGTEEELPVAELAVVVVATVEPPVIPMQ